MHDALLVRGLEGVGDLPGNPQRFLERDGPLVDPIRQRRPLDQFHDEIVGPDVVQGADVRMIERGNRARFTFETVAEVRGGDLDCDFAPEPRVARAIHLTHSAGTDGLDDFVRPEPCPRRHAQVRAYAGFSFR